MMFISKKVQNYNNSIKHSISYVKIDINKIEFI